MLEESHRVPLKSERDFTEGIYVLGFEESSYGALLFILRFRSKIAIAARATLQTMSDFEVRSGESVTLHKVLQEVAKDFLHGHHDGPKGEDVEWPHGHSSLAFFHRTRDSFRERSPQIKEAVRKTSSDIVQWMHEGGAWRAFLVTAVGIVLLLGLAGIGAFMFFFLVATLNAVVVGFLGSLASVGAFTAFFFITLTAVYIGALIVAVLSISTITFVCICAALTVSGWIAFFWVLWQGLKKGVDVCKASYFMSVSSLTTVTSGGL